MNDADYLVYELRLLLAKYREPNPPLKTDDALNFGQQIRQRFEQLDRLLSKGGQFPHDWVTKQNQVAPNTTRWDYGND